MLCSCISYQKKVSHCTCSQTICHKALFLLKRTCLDGKGRHITSFEHHTTSSASNTPRHEFLVVYPRIKIEGGGSPSFLFSPSMAENSRGGAGIRPHATPMRVRCAVHCLGQCLLVAELLACRTFCHLLSMLRLYFSPKVRHTFHMPHFRRN